ncbi:MAG: T9SS type A sorting domain-containing protein [Lentisphaeria bacterium]|nr:T9SS type A sorting domain-containing protein [Candidatus Neomarinimicrobiota bacterium]MCF7843126.1 T9SS type A sorting domain-containing protein [Lentisphaeria bacterium]
MRLKRHFLALLLVTVWFPNARAATDSLAITISIAPAVSISQEQLPATFEVSKPYPNPFNPTTRFTIALPEAATVDVQVFDIRGKRIAQLAADDFNAGYHAMTWRADHAASGVYLIRVSTPLGHTIQKVLLLK